MDTPIAIGRAHDERETFIFTVEPFVSGGYVLSIRYSGDGDKNTTGGGVWPSIGKAKEIAEETAQRMLHGAIVEWEQDQSRQL